MNCELPSPSNLPATLASGCTYLVVAYRWGWLNNHTYYVYAGPDEDAALELAETEAQDRGGKYGVAVLCFGPVRKRTHTERPDEIIYEEPPCPTLQAYFPSSYGEEAPETNPRIEMFRRIGQVTYFATKDGTAMLPDPHDPGRLTTAEVDVPPWLKDETARIEAQEHAIHEVVKKAKEQAAEQPQASPAADDSSDNR